MAQPKSATDVCDTTQNAKLLLCKLQDFRTAHRSTMTRSPHRISSAYSSASYASNFCRTSAEIFCTAVGPTSRDALADVWSMLRSHSSNCACHPPVAAIGDSRARSTHGRGGSGRVTGAIDPAWLRRSHSIPDRSQLYMHGSRIGMIHHRCAHRVKRKTTCRLVLCCDTWSSSSGQRGPSSDPAAGRQPASCLIAN